MPGKFFYKAQTPEGEIIHSFIEAEDEYEAELLLIEKGLDVFNLRAANLLDNLSTYLEKLKEALIKVTLKDLIVFTRQFATLFSAGIPITTILERLRDQQINPKFKKALAEILKDVEAGSTLHMAFSKHKDIFPGLYTGMIKVGEEGGVLDIILTRIAAILETQLTTENRIKTATRYPKLVISGITIAFVVLLTFVIPRFVSLFSKFGAELPLPTRILIWINHAFTNYWWCVIGIVFAGVIAFKRYRKTPHGKLKTDELLLRLPIIGELMKKIYIARIARILGLLYRSGIPITTSFDIITEVTGNERFKIELRNIRNLITTGTSIHAAVRTSTVFPLIVADMIESGEDTGQLDEMLFKVADYFDEETEYAIQNLSSAIEPILLVFIAGMILLIALGVFLPMWDMIKVYKG